MSENLLAGDIVKISTGLCYFYAGYIPARGHFVKDAHGKTILVPNHERPELIQKQTQPPPGRSQYELYRMHHPSRIPSPFPDDLSY